MGAISKLLGAGLKQATKKTGVASRKTLSKKFGGKSAAGKKLKEAQAQYDKMNAGLKKTKFKNEQAKVDYKAGLKVYKDKLDKARVAYHKTTSKGKKSSVSRGAPMGGKDAKKSYLTTDPIQRKKHEVGSKAFEGVSKLLKTGTKKKKKPMATKKKTPGFKNYLTTDPIQRKKYSTKLTKEEVAGTVAATGAVIGASELDKKKGKK